MLAASAGFSPAHAVNGPVIDLTAFTCAAFLQALEDGHADEMRDLSIWLDGYLASMTGDTRLDWNNLRQFFDDLYVHCRMQQGRDLLSAAHEASR
ncbi:MAG: hypothetical protein N2Z69_06775 [Methylophilaceae bacterium]|nr:hypothetical protein [Methylophilaceae bacterium]